MPLPKEILLVNPWIYDFTAYDFWMKPLGLLYVAAVLRRQSGLRLRFVDCLDRSHPGLALRKKGKPDGRGPLPKEEVAKPEVLRNIPRRFSRYGIPPSLFEAELDRLPPPDAVLVTSGMTYWYPGAFLAIDLIRRKWGRVPVVLGGIYPSLAREHARRFSGADIVIAGPGEDIVLKHLADILGSGSIRPEEFPDLEAIPPPAFDLLRDRATLPLLTSRGCPMRCSFCASPFLYPRFERRSARSVIEEIETLVRRWGARNIAFYDDALLLDHKHYLLPILRGVAERRLEVDFHTPNGLHVREIDAAVAASFRQARVRSLYLSQESFDQRLLGRSCPKVGPGDLEKALAALEEAGYRRPEVNVYLIVGLPGQDISLVRESFIEVKRLGAKPRLAFFSPVPGTADHDRLVERGVLSADSDPLLHNKLAFAYLWGDIAKSDLDSLLLPGDMLS